MPPVINTNVATKHFILSAVWIKKYEHIRSRSEWQRANTRLLYILSSNGRVFHLFCLPLAVADIDRWTNVRLKWINDTFPTNDVELAHFRRRCLQALWLANSGLQDFKIIAKRDFFTNCVDKLIDAHSPEGKEIGGGEGVWLATLGGIAVCIYYSLLL